MASESPLNDRQSLLRLFIWVDFDPHQSVLFIFNYRGQSKLQFCNLNVYMWLDLNQGWSVLLIFFQETNYN